MQQREGKATAIIEMEMQWKRSCRKFQNRNAAWFIFIAAPIPFTSCFM
jgi:hypothetical protein